MEHTLCLTYGQLVIAWLVTMLACWIGGPLGWSVYQRLKQRS